MKHFHLSLVWFFFHNIKIQNVSFSRLAISQFSHQFIVHIINFSFSFETYLSQFNVQEQISLLKWIILIIMQFYPST